jgi:hypothetical protein
MDDMKTFFPKRKRHGALANTMSPALKFRGNDIGVLLFLLFKRFSAVSQMNFFRIFAKIFEYLKTNMI